MKLVLLSPGESALRTVKEIKDLFGLGLKEAKDLVDQSPSLLVESNDTEYINSIARQLESIGAQVELK